MANRSLGANIATSAANVVAVVAASLLAVPLLIDGLGLAGYGLWTLAQSLVIYVTTAELGFGPAIARFSSVRADTHGSVRQILVLSVGLYVGVGLAVVAACHVAAQPLVDLFSVPASYRADAIATVGLMGWVAFVALVGAPLGHVLTGLERFTALTATNVAGSVTFLAVLAVSLHQDAQLQDAATAALLQWTVVLVLRVLVLHRVLRAAGPLRPQRRLLQELLGFSARLQIAVLATLLNTQTDRVVIGAVAPATTLGQASIATQVAEASRFLAYAAFTPMASRMAVAFGAEGRGALDALLQRHRHVWTAAVLGAIAIGVGAVRPAIAAWLGEGYDQAALFAALLLAAYGVSLLPGPAFAYLRAVGAPGVEGMFGVVTVAVNLVATVTLGIVAGATGVVAATTVAYLASSAWALRRTHGSVPAATGGSPGRARVTVALLVAAAATYGSGEALLALLPRALALVGIGASAIAVFVLFLAFVMRLAPGPALRRLVAKDTADGG